MRFVVKVFSEDISNAEFKEKKYVWGHEKEATINIAGAHLLFTLVPSTLRQVKHPIHKSYQENDFKLLFIVVTVL